MTAPSIALFSHLPPVDPPLLGGILVCPSTLARVCRAHLRDALYIFSSTLSTSTAHDSFFFSPLLFTQDVVLSFIFPLCPSSEFFPHYTLLVLCTGFLLYVGKKRHLTSCYVAYYPCLPLSQREKKMRKTGNGRESKRKHSDLTLVFDVCFISTPIGCRFPSARGSPQFRGYYWCREVRDARGGVR